MKQFDLDEYLANPSRKVVTRDGRKVRIICTDRKSKDDYPIIALIEGFGGEEDYLCYPRDGKWPSCKNVDLFFAPEKHEGWVNIYRNDNYFVRDANVWLTEEDAKRNALSDHSITIKIQWEEWMPQENLKFQETYYERITI